MTTISRSIHQIAEIVGRVFSRVAAMVIGFVLMTLGLGMMVAVVMLPVGILLAVLGVLLFLAGIFAPENLNEQQRRQ